VAARNARGMIHRCFSFLSLFHIALPNNDFSEVFLVR